MVPTLQQSSQTLVFEANGGWISLVPNWELVAFFRAITYFFRGHSPPACAMNEAVFRACFAH